MSDQLLDPNANVQSARNSNSPNKEGLHVVTGNTLSPKSQRQSASGAGSNKFKNIQNLQGAQPSIGDITEEDPHDETATPLEYVKIPMKKAVTTQNQRVNKITPEDPLLGITQDKLNNDVESLQKQLEAINDDAIRKDLFRAFFQQTQFIKEVKQLKEKRQQNKSMLIYGTNDMQLKIYKDQKEHLLTAAEPSSNDKKKKEKDQDTSEKPKKKKCADHFKFDPKSSAVTTFDTILILIIAYSCFLSMFFTAFDYSFEKFSLFWILEVIVFSMFTLDILLSFMRLPLNDDSEEGQTHSSIAKKYFKSGQAIFDILATFPFFLIQTEDGSNVGLYFKLLRLMRIPRIINLLDMDKCNKVIDLVFQNQPRGQRVVFQNMMKTVYKVYRLILVTLMLTYFLGCIFYLSSHLQTSQLGYNAETFVTMHMTKDQEGKEYDKFFKLISTCYFSITTLSTVGYGDLYPVSEYEQLLIVLVMLGGVAFFSYIMGRFIEIISSFNQSGVEEQTFQLHNWMTLITRFRENRPLPNSLYRQINSHFKYYWARNRISEVESGNEFISALPRTVKRGIVVHYLFDDVFYNFRFFFNPNKYKDSKFLHDVAFGLRPRHFSDDQEECVIYDEEEEVIEMYFIMKGQVGIGFNKYQEPLQDTQQTRQNQFELTFFLNKNQFFGDYYICNNFKAEFVHIVAPGISDVEAFALPKKFLMQKIFPDYPRIYREIKEESQYRYNSWIRNSIMKHKLAHIEQVNKRSTYNSINLKCKQTATPAAYQLLLRNFHGNTEVNANSRQQFQERIMAVDDKMGDIDKSMEEFLDVISSNFNGIIGKIENMKGNMVKIKRETREAKKELEQLQINIKQGTNQLQQETNMQEFNLHHRVV